jgi:hypothetical protein
MSIEDLVNNVDIMPGSSLLELWKYREKVRAILVSDLTEFKGSGARDTIAGHCTRLSSSGIPSWLDQYIESIEKSPHLFDSAEFHIAMARHFMDVRRYGVCGCVSVSGQTIRNFWEALASVIHGSFKKASMVDVRIYSARMLNILQAELALSLEADLALSLVRDQDHPQAQFSTTTSPPAFNFPDANLIIRSSDLVNFRVHKPVLAIASPFFEDLLSLPQPSDSESVEGIPVVQLSEDSELLNSLISMLYPVPTVIPNSYEKVLYSLANRQQ